MNPSINEWCFSIQNPGAEPENQRKCISGIVTGSTVFDDGDNITIFSIQNVTMHGDDILVTTFSGAVYILGVVDPHYEMQYPNAIGRLLKAYEQ